jgi:hypothetical protein
MASVPRALEMQRDILAEDPTRQMVRQSYTPRCRLMSSFEIQRVFGRSDAGERERGVS